MIATITLWRSAQDIDAYAYGRDATGHRHAMNADRRKALHHRGVFIRFQPVESQGQLEGHNSLDGDWLTQAKATNPT